MTWQLVSMRTAAFAAALAFAVGMAMPLNAGEGGDEGWMALPSGARVHLAEIIWDEEERMGRFRFIAPALPDHADDADAIDDDMHALCQEFARHIQRGLRPGWESIVIAIAQAPVPFGEYDPAVLQLFGGFLIEGTDCEWDDF